ncbi:hypothetical protein A4H97_20160 [Niastella yeongjuensis]|uniref:Uncharacterized protein n=2 Tax=Niastella yeongjuensis TaxID=354355 RepID=A0A1V9FCB1_9BACT|nr:hypothetical protein A4H97_20160 [Niastella yeongjuensis]
MEFYRRLGFHTLAGRFFGPEGFANGNDVAITVDGTGAPYVAYGNPSNGNNIAVKTYDGSSWVDVGTPAALTGTTITSCLKSTIS